MFDGLLSHDLLQVGFDLLTGGTTVESQVRKS